MLMPTSKRTTGTGRKVVKPATGGNKPMRRTTSFKKTTRKATSTPRFKGKKK